MKNYCMKPHGLMKPKKINDNNKYPYTLWLILQKHYAILKNFGSKRF